METLRERREGSLNFQDKGIKNDAEESINLQFILLRINDAVYQRCRIARCIEHQVSHFQRQC